MGLITDYNRGGFTYIQATSPPGDAELGDTWFNTTTGTIFIHNGTQWIEGFDLYVEPPPSPGDRAIFGGGYAGGDTNVLDYITITSTGNAADFGDLTTTRRHHSATSNGINDRGVWNAGTSPGYPVNLLDYVTISSASNATDFGDCIVSTHMRQSASNGSNDRGIVAAGSGQNVIEYYTISTTGNTTDFGDMTTTVTSSANMGTDNGTNERGIHVHGIGGQIHYITISSTGNSTSFGSLLQSGRYYCGSLSNDTNDRGLIGGDDSGAQNAIEYITISSTGNGTDFGDLTVGGNYLGGTGNGTNDRGIWSSRLGATDVIDYVTVSSLGNAIDFGNLSVARYNASPTSNGAL